MGWTNTQQTEITAPDNVPFAAGQDVIGIGTALPDELVNAGIGASLIFYNSGWDPTSTTPMVKFFFIGTFEADNGGAVAIGMGICQNPSVSAVAVVTTVLNAGLYLPTPTEGETFVTICNAAGNPMWQVFPDASHNGIELGLNDAGDILWQLPGNAG